MGPTRLSAGLLPIRGNTTHPGCSARDPANRRNAQSPLGFGASFGRQASGFSVSGEKHVPETALSSRPVNEHASPLSRSAQASTASRGGRGGPLPLPAPPCPGLPRVNDTSRDDESRNRVCIGGQRLRDRSQRPSLSFQRLVKAACRPMPAETADSAADPAEPLTAEPSRTGPPPPRDPTAGPLRRRQTTGPRPTRSASAPHGQRCGT